MGATTFQETGEGKTAQAAFAALVKSARHEHGHGGYSGTIAEKDKMVMVTREVMPVAAAVALADKLIEAGDPRIDDKRGPAGCIQVGPTSWLFFGWAAE